MYISSDTNIWFDFEEIGFLNHPFFLDSEYYLSDIAYHEEIQFSEPIRDLVDNNRLRITSMSAIELNKAIDFHDNKYKSISFNDAYALSIASERGWILLTGDKRLVEAAKLENVEYHGTLWIYRQLKEQNKLPINEYRCALKRLLDAVDDGKRRLPREEILNMINEI